MEKHNIIPIAEENWMHQDKVAFDTFMMLGLPTELSTADIREGPGGLEMVGKVTPTMAWVTQLEAAPEDIEPTRYPRFVGQVGRGGLKDVDGMSGCPIFGFSKAAGDRYWVVAIQSSWLAKRRIIFGTPIPILAQLIEDGLDGPEGQEAGRVTGQ